jgi:hypothetical protein
MWDSGEGLTCGADRRDVTVANQSAGRCVVEIQAYAFGDRRKLFARLQGALAASGCATVMYTKLGRSRMQYNFETDLEAIVDLYCGLVEAGLELTESGHRILTELCARRSHQRRPFGLVFRPEALRIRLVVGFGDACRSEAGAGALRYG